MQIVRTIVWVLLLFSLLAFSFFNWKPVEVQIWSNIVLETKLPALVVIAFLLGLVPMWLIHRTNKWRLTRRVSALEAATTRLSTPAPAASAETAVPAAPTAPPRRDLPPEPSNPGRSGRSGAVETCMTNPIYLALDVPRLQEGIDLAQKVTGHIGGIKLGLEFFCAHGAHGVHLVGQLGLPLFLDLKLHDIPNTVAAAIQAIHVLEPSILTVHASGGRAMLEDAKAAAGEHTKVVGVTMLTSMDARDLARTGVAGSAHDQVMRLAELAQDAGLDGIVCSGQEVGAVHDRWKDGFFVVPGLRPAGSAAGDQKRVVTPRQARDDGASVLVIGRPITRAEDPARAAREIEATL